MYLALTEHERELSRSMLFPLVRENTDTGSSRFYVDCTNITRKSKAMYQIGKLFYDLIQTYCPHVVAVGGCGAGASPIVDAVVMTSAMAFETRKMPVIDGFEVLREPGGRGKTVLGIENVNPTGTVAIVDDVIDTGSTVLYAMDQMKQLGLEVALVLTMVNCQNTGMTLVREKHGVKAASLITKDELARGQLRKFSDMYHSYLSAR